MKTDEQFLRAIADDRADDTPRIKYAAWLEQRGDPRAKFLRLQQAFLQRPLSIHAYRDLCAREQELVKELNATWMQRVRRYATPPPCRDITQLVPELAPFARTTTRLHPHRVPSPLPAWMSKIGGRFLWPAAEPWPSCPECNVNLTPVLQLRKRDILDVAFPDGTDLLQLFWCPDEAAHDYRPSPHIWWRSEAEIAKPRNDDPDLSRFPRKSDYEGYVPYECAVHPERVTDYLMMDDLYFVGGEALYKQIAEKLETLDIGSAEDLADRLEPGQKKTTARSLVFSELTQCPATKVGGKPGMEEDGRKFEHLVTFSSWEMDAASFRRWMAVEDQRLLAPPGKKLTWPQLSKRPEWQPLQEVMGMELGRTQQASVYICRDEFPWKVLAYVHD